MVHEIKPQTQQTNTHTKHARTHARTHTHTRTRTRIHTHTILTCSNAAIEQVGDMLP